MFKYNTVQHSLSNLPALAKDLTWRASVGIMWRNRKGSFSSEDTETRWEPPYNHSNKDILLTTKLCLSNELHPVLIFYRWPTGLIIKIGTWANLVNLQCWCNKIGYIVNVLASCLCEKVPFFSSAWIRPCIQRPLPFWTLKKDWENTVLIKSLLASLLKSDIIIKRNHPRHTKCSHLGLFLPFS